MSVKPKTNFWIDLLAFICFIFAGISGIALGFFLPHGIPRSGLKTFLGITKHSWKSLHKWSAICFIIIIFIHIIVHWQWIIYTTKKIIKPILPRK